MKAADWIDRVKSAKGWDSDYRVAKELGFKANTISMYRANGTPMDEAIVLKVAHALEINPALVLADQAMERAKNEEAKSAWAAVLERLGGMAAAVVLGVGLTASPPPANAAQAPATAPLCILCKVTNRRKERRQGVEFRLSTITTALQALFMPARLVA